MKTRGRRQNTEKDSLQILTEKLAADERNAWSHRDDGGGNGSNDDGLSTARRPRTNARKSNGSNDDGASSSRQLPTNARTTRSGGSTGGDSGRATRQSATTNAGAKRGDKGSKRNPNLLCSNTRVVRASEEAKYEAFVDPYRGVQPFFFCHDEDDGDGADRRWAADAKSPWAKCADVLSENSQTWTFSNGEDGAVEVVNVDEDEDDGEKEERALLVKCGCPSVDELANDQWEAYNKQQIAKKKRAARGRKRKNSGDNENEVKPEKDDGDAIVAEDDGKAPKIGDSCGTKSMKIICGERRPDAKHRCPCDYNPFCLASLGGIVDQYRRSAAKIKYGVRGNKTEPTPPELARQIQDDMAAELDSSAVNSDGKKGKKDKGGDLRVSLLVDRDAIAAHLSRFARESGDDDIVIEGCLDTLAVGAMVEGAIEERLDRIRRVHKPLLFPSPRDEDEKQMELSVPSGLRNLGATCYLNSQLQCLAQNLGFVRGLFSWRRPPHPVRGGKAGGSSSAADRRMSTVISSMQSILANMRYGPERVICTREFATALSLEEGEMQDPNEFARLLFDRMSESFRRSAEVARNGMSGRNGSLGELLPSVFGGTFVYVTTCRGCGRSSERKEEFMELSAPIVDPREEDGSSSGKQRTRKARDVDVQQCIDSYLHPERLDGDNRYECSGCNKKCDAVRRMVFARLPPVLNIQLARYVFDRETFSKRKLTTRVLLPKSLSIPGDAILDVNSQRARYVLCAVQNHLGNSAHGGHYVAEVMDWTTGVWYEFNDEDVTMLEGGPTSGFEPRETEEETETDELVEHRKVRGSADAYNLFYVERSYLSHQCEGELRPSNFMECDDILRTVVDGRRERYRLELEIQKNNALEGDRIRARQERILNNIFLPTSKMVIPTEGNKIWVNYNFLRRFFSRRDGLEDIFQIAESSSKVPDVTQNAFLFDRFLCKHSEGLCPKVARKGKLLPLEVYEAVEDIMREEYAMFLHNRGSDAVPSPEMSLTKCRLVDVQCKDCGLSYQREARRKFDLFQTLVSIHDDLIAGTNDLDPDAVPEPSSIHAISRTWATAMRKYAEKKVNELQITQQKKASGEGNNVSCGGIDCLDLSEVEASKNDEEGEQNEDQSSNAPSIKTSNSFRGEDPTSKISCQHGHCPSMFSRKSVRWIPENVWRRITKVFPDAIPHRYAPPSDDAIGNCVHCHREKEEESQFPQKLNDWWSKIAQPGDLSELLERGNEFPSQIGVFVEHWAEGSISLYALRHIDVQRWRDSFTTVEKSLKSRKKNDAIRKQLDGLLFLRSESSPSVWDWKFRQPACKKHGLVVGIPPASEEEDIKSWLEKLNPSNVELLLKAEYLALMDSLSTLGVILHGESSASLEETRPPVSIQLHKGIPTIKIDPQTCTSGCIIASSGDECTENGKASSNVDKTQSSKPEKDVEPIGKGPKGPLCKVLVHEIERNMDIEVSASKIMLEVNDDNTITSSSNGRPRRSRKARGERGNGFPIYEVEMALDGNLAHFRLLLNQSKYKKLFGQRLFLLRTSPSPLFDESTEELTHVSNRKTIHEIISEPLSLSNARNSEQQKDCTIHLILSYESGDMSNLDGTRRSTRKRMSQEEKEEEETLLTSLTEVACGGWKTADDESDVVAKEKKSKRRRRERGFQGTFLHQSSELDEPDGSASSENAEVPETLQHDDSRDVVIVDSPQDTKSVASENNVDDQDGMDVASANDSSNDEDLSEDVMAVDIPEDEKSIGNEGSDREDTVVASVKDDVHGGGDLRRQRLDDVLNQGLRVISNCIRGPTIIPLRERILSATDEWETARAVVRRELVQHIDTHLLNMKENL